MFHLNSNYQKLDNPYFFTEVAKRTAEYSQRNPGQKVIRFGVGDVTRPLTKTVVKALHDAVDEMAEEKSFHGYTQPQGYEFLRDAIASFEYKRRGCPIGADEIFISDGAKTDSGNIQEIFAKDNRIALCDPGYPVYLDSNLMTGKCERDDVIYLPCTEANGFIPELPKQTPDLIYLCFPNNPTGAAITKQALQEWVDYANKNGTVIIFDAAYEAYITEDEIPHTIYECPGAENCAIEIRSFSKNAGFTGVRLGYTVIPKAIRAENGISAHSLWYRRIGTRFNGAGYIQQRAGAAVYTEAGQQEIRELVSYYQENAKMIREGLQEAGYTVYGGVNAPYLWLKAKEKMTSWEFFDHLLNRAAIVTTPGSGFGPSGESFLRLTAFGSHENTKEAVERVKSIS